MDSLEADIMKGSSYARRLSRFINLLSFTVQAKHEYAQNQL